MIMSVVHFGSTSWFGVSTDSSLPAGAAFTSWSGPTWSLCASAWVRSWYRGGKPPNTRDVHSGTAICTRHIQVATICTAKRCWFVRLYWRAKTFRICLHMHDGWICDATPRFILFTCALNYYISGVYTMIMSDPIPWNYVYHFPCESNHLEAWIIFSPSLVYGPLPDGYVWPRRLS